jgi:hypothetical protein
MFRAGHGNLLATTASSPPALREILRPEGHLIAARGAFPEFWDVLTGNLCGA